MVFHHSRRGHRPRYSRWFSFVFLGAQFWEPVSWAGCRTAPVRPIAATVPRKTCGLENGIQQFQFPGFCSNCLVTCLPVGLAAVEIQNQVKRGPESLPVQADRMRRSIGDGTVSYQCRLCPAICASNSVNLSLMTSLALCRISFLDVAGRGPSIPSVGRQPSVRI